MKRREFITLLGGAAAASPIAAHAQQPGKIYTIGLLSPAPFTLGYTAFSDALRELGWIEGRNLAFERRSAENRLERLPDLAAELVRLNVERDCGTWNAWPSGGQAGHDDYSDSYGERWRSVGERAR
jgi:putative tryptophan/tyrosine transport system substrate-binding protein